MRLKFWSAEGAIRDYRYSQICRLCNQWRARSRNHAKAGSSRTWIHTEDMARSRAFYEGVLGLEPYSDNRLLRYGLAGRDVLFSQGHHATARGYCLAAPSPAMVVMARYMWLLPSARMNLIVGRRTSLHAASPSKGVMIGRAVAAAFISATQGTFWNSQAGIVVRATQRYSGPPPAEFALYLRFCTEQLSTFFGRRKRIHDHARIAKLVQKRRILRGKGCGRINLYAPRARFASPRHMSKRWRIYKAQWFNCASSHASEAISGNTTASPPPAVSSPHYQEYRGAKNYKMKN